MVTSSSKSEPEEESGQAQAYFVQLIHVPYSHHFHHSDSELVTVSAMTVPSLLELSAIPYPRNLTPFLVLPSKSASHTFSAEILNGSSVTSISVERVWLEHLHRPISIYVTICTNSVLILLGLCRPWVMVSHCIAEVPIREWVHKLLYVQDQVRQWMKCNNDPLIQCYARNQHMRTPCINCTHFMQLQLTVNYHKLYKWQHKCGW